MAAGSIYPNSFHTEILAKLLPKRKSARSSAGVSTIMERSVGADFWPSFDDGSKIYEITHSS
jgi:hypothetical protein